MAQPPNSSETFLREVDEDLRRDQLRDFARRYGSWLIAGLLLFIAACGGLLYWNHYQQQQSEAQVERLSKAFRDIGENKVASANAELATIAGSSNPALRATVKFTQAAIAAQRGNRKDALDTYRQIAADDDYPVPYRDIALIRQTALEFDDLKPDAVIARLEPLAKPGEPWFGSAGEMTVLALIKQGKSREAGAFAASVAKDPTVPNSIRARLAQLAGTLGVDTSAIQASLTQQEPK